MVGGRGKGEPDTGTNHLGFRCVQPTGRDFRSGCRRVRVTVADNGRGIDPSLRSHIFEPFFTTKGTIGTGLGLWVSKQIIDKHGGSIRMRSSTDGARRGTVFSIFLPIEPAAATRS
jgi:signal transduction histidine kinase